MNRIFFDNVTGVPILDVQPQNGLLETVERNITQFTILSERNPDTFDYIDLDYSHYAQDFAESNGYRVNPETKELEFSYPDPNAPEDPPVFQPPLTEQVLELKTKQVETNKVVAEITAAQQDLLELLIEMEVI